MRAGRTGDVTALLRACLTALRLPAEAGARYRVRGPPFWSMADAAERIRAMLELVGEEGAALAAVLPEVALDAPERKLRCRVAVPGTFLAGLKLTRDGLAELTQVVDWRSIRVGKPKLPQAVAN